jgi:hypothetical protein
VKEDRYLISPTDLGLGGSPSRATEPEPFIVFEPDNILEQSSPDDTARLAKWPPLLKHVPKGAFVYRKSLRQEDSCANYPFREVVEDELKQLYSRMKNNDPSEETLGWSVVQIMKTLQRGMDAKGVYFWDIFLHHSGRNQLT